MIRIIIFDDGQVVTDEKSLFSSVTIRHKLSSDEEVNVSSKLGKEYKHFTEKEVRDEVKREVINEKIDELKDKKTDLLFSLLVDARKRLDKKESIEETIEPTKTVESVGKNEGPVLPNGFEWCRKAKYDVLIECGCYKIDDEHPLMPGFESIDIERDGVMVTYAVKSGTNELEGNSWVTNPDRPYIITGTVGERWPVKPSNLGSYEVNPEDITTTPLPISTKDPSDQEFLVAFHVPEGETVKVISKWAYKDDGSIDESQVLTTNLPDSKIPHGNGDYIVAKHIDGEPEYMELPEEIRNTKEAATKYSPRVINGSVMETTYDHAATKEEIISKYMSSKVL